jgi:hypothetical protein
LGKTKRLSPPMGGLAKREPAQRPVRRAAEKRFRIIFTWSAESGQR